MTLENGALEIVGEYRYGERSAIILKRFSDASYIVGKNFTRSDNDVSWCWGCYDIKSASDAQKIALAWIF